MNDWQSNETQQSFKNSFLMFSSHASQEQTLGGKKWPSVVNPLGMFYIVLGTIKAINEKNWLGNIAFTA